MPGWMVPTALHQGPQAGIQNRSVTRPGACRQAQTVFTPRHAVRSAASRQCRSDTSPSKTSSRLSKVAFRSRLRGRHVPATMFRGPVPHVDQAAGCRNPGTGIGDTERVIADEQTPPHDDPGLHRQPVSARASVRSRSDRGHHGTEGMRARRGICAWLPPASSSSSPLDRILAIEVLQTLKACTRGPAFARPGDEDMSGLHRMPRHEPDHVGKPHRPPRTRSWSLTSTDPADSARRVGLPIPNQPSRS